MPETYPEIAPECDVLEYSDSLDPADCVNIEKFIRETCEDQLGEIMCFTIIRYGQIVRAVHFDQSPLNLDLPLILKYFQWCTRPAE